MKRMMILLGLILTLLASFAASAQTEQKHTVVFDRAFAQPLNPSPGKPFGLRAAVYVDNVFYAYLGDALYAWKPGDAQPAKYCTLPQPPIWREAWRKTPLHKLPQEEQTQLQQSVDYLAGGDGALWGYNLISGKIGRINEQGIAWQDQALNTAALFKNGLVVSQFWPIQSFVEDGSLYLFGDSNVKKLGMGKLLLRFDLRSGACFVVNVSKVRNICAYRPGTVLVAQKNNRSSMKLSVLNLKTESIEELPLTIPFPDRSEEGMANIGGLGYDAKNDSIYFVFGETPLSCDVWQSKRGKPFQSILRLNACVFEETPGWVLRDGQYAFSEMEGLHICTIE